MWKAVVIFFIKLFINILSVFFKELEFSYANYTGFGYSLNNIRVFKYATYTYTLVIYEHQPAARETLQFCPQKVGHTIKPASSKYYTPF